MRSPLALVFLLLACGASGGVSKPPAGGEPSTTTNGSLHLRLDGIDLVFLHGVAEADGPLLRVVVADRPIGCGAVPRSDHASLAGVGSAFVMFELPRGPGGGYFDGRSVGTFVWFVSPELSAEARPHVASVAIDAFSSKDGARALGRMHVDARRPRSFGKTDAPAVERFTVDGTFDVRVCNPRGELDAPVGDEGNERPTIPLGARLVGLEQFAPTSALAWVEHDVDNDVDVLSSVHLFAETVDCAGLDHALGNADSLSLDGFGASAREAKLGTPLPASADFHFQGPKAKRPHPSWLSEPPDVLGAQGWLSFDTIAFAAGAHVTGVAHLGSGPLDVAGRFDAVVCRR